MGELSSANNIGGDRKRLSRESIEACKNNDWKLWHIFAFGFT